MIRNYVDIYGHKRQLKFHSKPTFLVPYMRQGDGPMISTVTRWIDESGFITQIPDEAWMLVNYQDSNKEDSYDDSN
jgi:hypothetical protein